MKQINLPTDEPTFEVSANLDGTTYALTLDWSTRAGVWFLTVALPTAEGQATIIARRCPCVRGVPLLAGVVTEGRPLGELVVVGDRDAERFDFGTHARLIYITSAELASLGA